MNCLDGQIGVIGLSGYDSTKSGLYINDLPGLTLNQLDKIKDDTEDYLDVSTAWERIYTRAKKNLEFDVLGANRKHFKRSSIISSRMTGQISPTLLISQGVYSGHYFDFTNYPKTLEFFLNACQIYLDSAATVTVKIYDATMGIVLSTYSGTLAVPGLLTIPIQESFSMFEYPRLFVCYDDTSVDAHKADDYYYTDFTFNYTKEISTASSVVYSSLSAANTGLILNYNVKCGIISWMCQNIDAFIKPLWYKLGVEWMNERFGSDKINRYTMLNMEEAQALKAQFQEEYATSLEDSLNGMSPTYDGYCFDCSGLVNKKIMLP